MAPAAGEVKLRGQGGLAWTATSSLPHLRTLRAAPAWGPDPGAAPAGLSAGQCPETSNAECGPSRALPGREPKPREQRAFTEPKGRARGGRRSLSAAGRGARPGPAPHGLSPRAQRGAESAELAGSIPGWAINVTVGVDGPCGSFPTRNILWSWWIPAPATTLCLQHATVYPKDCHGPCIHLTQTSAKNYTLVPCPTLGFTHKTTQPETSPSSLSRSGFHHLMLNREWRSSGW